MDLLKKFLTIKKGDMSARINTNGFRFSGRTYHRKGAHGVQMGSYGIKHLLRGFSHFSYVKDVEELELDSLEAIRLSQMSNSEINILLEGKPKWIPSKGDASIELSRQRIRDYDLELKRFSIKSRNRLLEIINADEECLEVLRRRRSRIVDTIWVILDAKIESSVTTGGEMKMQMDAAKGLVKLKGQTGGEFSREIDLEIGADTVFAYRMLRPQFSGRNREGKVNFLRSDYRGLF